MRKRNIIIKNSYLLFLLFSLLIIQRNLVYRNISSPVLGGSTEVNKKIAVIGIDEAITVGFYSLVTLAVVIAIQNDDSF